ANYPVGTVLALFNDRVQSTEIIKDGSETPLAAEDGEVVLADEGVYQYVVTQTNGKKTSVKFQVINADGMVYRYATAEERSFNFHNEGTTWLREFNGEYGVQKANTAQSSLRFDIGNEPFDFDYIVVKIYFETSELTQMEIGSFWVNLGKLPTNQWVEWIIPRTSIQTSGSRLYHDYATEADPASYEDFKALVFGDIGCNQQHAFDFDLISGSATAYISTIRYGSYPQVENAIYTFDTNVDWSGIAGGLNSRAWDDAYGESTWVETFEGEHGVQRANVVQSFFSFDIGSEAFEFDYINARVYFASEKATVNVYCGDVLVAENVETNKWVTLKITSDMVNGANGHFMKVCGWYPLLAPSNMFDLQSYANQVMFYFDVKDSEGNATDVTTYLSYVSYDPLTTKTVSFNTNGHGSAIGDVLTSQGNRIAAGNIPADPTDDNYSFTGWYTTEDCTGDAIDLANYVFQTSTTLYARWIVKIPVIENAIYSFDTNVDWSGIVGGLNSRAWDDKYGESSWIEMFEGEHGVQKANTVQAYFTFDIGAEAFTFDYINVRIYFASEKATVNVYCGDVLVAENVETNKWVTLKITSNMVTATNSYFFKACSWYDHAEWEHKIAFEDQSWGNQDVFHFDIRDAEGNATNVTTYVSYISYDALTTKTVSFNTNGHGSAISDVLTSQGSKIAASDIPADPTDENYSFTGWYATEDCMGDAIDLKTYVFQTSTTLYARWIVKIPVIENAIYTFDTDVDWSAGAGGLNSRAWDDAYGESTWVETFEGEHGVQRANVVQSFFSFDIGSEAFEFDYINARVYFASEKATVNVYCGDVLVAENVETNKWVTLKITSDMVNGANGHFMKVCGWYPLLAPSNMFDLQSYANQVMFYFDVKDSEGNATDVTTYLSYVSYDPLTTKTVSFNTNGHGSAIGDVLTSQGNRIAASDIPADPTDENYTFTGCYTTEDCTGSAIDLKTFVFQTSTTLFAGWVEKAAIVENTIYSFDTDVDWSGIVGGLNSRAWDDKYGESTWMETFEGEQGVQKANSVQAYFTFDIGADVFTFDYITARVYFASEKATVNVYCGDVLVAENVETNKWVTLKIEKTAVTATNSYFFKACAWYDHAEWESKIAFDVQSWANQDVFHFDVKDSEGNATDVTTYLSKVAYVATEAE
ncbi:MAG: InlB B-repeat-containing protein, partial [Candidatus Fimimonas sp.]